MSKALVVGAGVTGLALAHELQRYAPHVAVTVCERSARVGGWVQSRRSELGGVIEPGPRSLNRIRGDLTLQLCAELGLADRIVPTSSTAATRFIADREGALQEIPTSIGAVLRTSWTRTAPLYLLRDAMFPRPLPDDLSVYQFAVDRFGARASDVLASSLVTGIFGGDQRR